MTKVCEGKARARIFVTFKDGRKEEIVIEPAPADVTVVSQFNPSCGRPGTWQYFTRDDLSSDTRTVAGYENDSFIVTGECSRQVYLRNAACGADRFVEGDGNCPAGSTRISNTKFTPSNTPESCEIVIKNSGGIVIYKKQAECPIRWKAACDDDCPPQSLKCKTAGYPGYKCKPCSEFRL